MKLDSLDEILRFAIRKEADAAAFYKMAADRSNPGVKETFQGIGPNGGRAQEKIGGI